MRDRARAASLDDDSGTALIELIGLGVMLLLPITYLAVSVFAVQKGVFAAGAAAREAGRAFVRSDSSATALEDADRAARLALEGQGITGANVSVHPAGQGCDDGPAAPALVPGASYVICVGFGVPLPFADRGFMADALHAVGVTGRTTVTVDDFRSER